MSILARDAVHAFRVALLEKLERERYELISGSYSEIELVTRRSWNRRGDELIQWLISTQGES